MTRIRPVGLKIGVGVGLPDKSVKAKYTPYKVKQLWKTLLQAMAWKERD